jgi:hypothetical protein
MTASVLTPNKRDSVGRNHKQMKNRARKQAAKAASRPGDVKTLLVTDTENMNPNEKNARLRTPPTKRKTPTKEQRPCTPTTTTDAFAFREESASHAHKQTPPANTPTKRSQTPTTTEAAVRDESASPATVTAPTFQGKSWLRLSMLIRHSLSQHGAHFYRCRDPKAEEATCWLIFVRAEHLPIAIQRLHATFHAWIAGGHEELIYT